ncbi:MAG: FKBP-type peptidyl-prolyl cis-trans isomerase, partial [Treponema sp.]|nr:FKBP-type peptidyl-prolyl cis-trans isomerase [Treponema sp.]
MKHLMNHGSSFTVKKFGGLLAGLIMASSLQAQDGAAEEQKKTDISYAYGLIIGSDLQGTGLEFDYDALSQGLQDAIEGRDSHLSLDDAVALVQQSYMAVWERQAEENRLSEIQFLEENGKRNGVITTESGLQYEVIRAEGKQKPGADAVVLVNYEGTLTDGTVFDSTYERGGAFEIPLDQVIPGWAEGVRLMGTGDTFIFYIPSGLAYGENG